MAETIQLPALWKTPDLIDAALLSVIPLGISEAIGDRDLKSFSRLFFGNICLLSSLSNSKVRNHMSPCKWLINVYLINFCIGFVQFENLVTIFCLATTNTFLHFGYSKAITVLSQENSDRVNTKIKDLFFRFQLLRAEYLGAS